jgi:group I intron endonuclease
MRKSGIYKISSIIKPDRCYIGSAVSISDRWTSHLHTLKKGRHRNERLQRHYNKYGKDDLVFSVIEECPANVLIEREQYYIDTLSPTFNINMIANSNYGRKWSDETRAKMSEAQKGLKKGQPAPNKGKPHSEETKAKLRKAWEKRRLIPISEETREKYRERMIGNSFWKLRKRSRNHYSKP